MYKAGIIINNSNCAHLPQKSSYNTMTFVELFEKCEKTQEVLIHFAKRCRLTDRQTTTSLFPGRFRRQDVSVSNVITLLL